MSTHTRAVSQDTGSSVRSSSPVDNLLEALTPYATSTIGELRKSMGPSVARGLIKGYSSTEAVNRYNTDMFRCASEVLRTTVPDGEEFTAFVNELIARHRKGEFTTKQMSVVAWLLGVSKATLKQLSPAGVNYHYKQLRTYANGGGGGREGYLLDVAGLIRLTINGSVKSSFGKMVERVLLPMLMGPTGFREIQPCDELAPGTWHLSDAKEAREEARAEADLTICLPNGVVVKVDVGINGDKTDMKAAKFSRYPNAAAIILTDRLPGPGSVLARTLEELSEEEMPTYAVAMNTATWTGEFYKLLEKLGDGTFVSPLPHDVTADEVKTLFKV